MTYNELHNITDKVVRKDSEAKELKRKYFEAKESFKRGNYMELYPMSVFAKKLAFSYLGKNQIKPAIKILEDIRQAIDDSKGNGMMNVWSGAFISIYPMLAFCNMEFSKWKKAEIILSQYVEHLGNLLTLPLWQNGNSSCDKEEETCGLFSREKVVEDLYQIFEKLCIHDRLVGNDNRAISNMLSIKGIITEYGSQYTQIKLSAFLTKCYDATGDDENFIESYKSFAKTYKRAQMMGASINDGLKSVCDDIFNIAYFN